MVNSRDSLSKIPKMNNDANPYIITLDIYKEGYWAYDISNYYKGRVDDNGTPFMVRWYEHGQIKNVHGMRPFIRGTVGQHTIDDKTDPDNPKITPSPDCSQIDQTGETTDTLDGGVAVYRMVNQCFTQEGMFYGEIGLKDSQGTVLSSVDIAFKVLGGCMNMIGARKFYVSEFEKALDNLNEIIGQTKKDFSEQLSQLITDSRNAYLNETKDAHDSLEALKSQIQANRDEQENLNQHLISTDQKIEAGDVVTNKHFTDVTDKLGTDIENKLSQISSTVPWFKDSDTIMKTYPNGYAGVVIAADTMHKWIFHDGMWNDAGPYKEDITENGEIIAYLDDGRVLTWDSADPQCSLNLSNISTGLSIKGASTISIKKDDIYKAFNSSTFVKLKDDIVSGPSFALIFYLSSKKLGVINPAADTISPDSKILFLHHFTSVNAGLLVDSQLSSQVKNFNNLIDSTNQRIGDSSYAYISGNNHDFSLNYQQDDCKMKFGSDWVELWSAGKTYDIKVSDILAAANKATDLVKVNSDNSISPKPGGNGRFTIYYDTATKTINFIDQANTRITPTGVRLFTHQYNSCDSGLLVDYAVNKGFFDLQKQNDQLKQKIEKDQVPSYFTENLNSGIDRVNQNMGEAGPNSMSFLFITDMHWGGNAKHSPALVHEVMRHTGLPLMVSGGDLFDQGEKNEMMQQATEAIGAIKQPGIFMANVFGNHDDNWNSWGGQHDHPERKFSYSDIYGYEFSYMMRDKKLVDDFHYLNLGVDFTYTFATTDASGQVWRFICVDTGNMTTGFNINQNSFNKILDLLKKSENEKIIFIAHIFSNNHAHTSFEQDLEKIVDARNSLGVCTLENQSSDTIDFSQSSNTSKIIACFGGHEHEDYDWTTPKGVPFILTDSDNAPRTETTKYSHEYGTVGEQCFDIMTINPSTKTIKAVRIGRGIDRQFTF